MARVAAIHFHAVQQQVFLRFSVFEFEFYRFIYVIDFHVDHFSTLHSYKFFCPDSSRHHIMIFSDIIFHYWIDMLIAVLINLITLRHDLHNFMWLFHHFITFFYPLSNKIFFRLRRRQCRACTWFWKLTNLFGGFIASMGLR